MKIKLIYMFRELYFIHLMVDGGEGVWAESARKALRDSGPIAELLQCLEHFRAQNRIGDILLDYSLNIVAVLQVEYDQVGLFIAQ